MTTDDSPPWLRHSHPLWAYGTSVRIADCPGCIEEDARVHLGDQPAPEPNESPPMTTDDRPLLPWCQIEPAFSQHEYAVDYCEAHDWPADSCRDEMAEARAAVLRELREEVEGLIEAAGGRCVKPADYEPGEMNICEKHSELWWDDGCEDQPGQLLAVLDIIRGLGE